VGTIEAPDVSPAAAADLLSTPEAGPVAVRGGALRMGSYLAGAVASTGAVALLFRHLGVVDTGRYTTAMSLAAVVTGLTDLGLTTIGMRELAVLRGERRAALARDLLGLRLALTVLGVAVMTAFAFLVYGPLLGLGVLIAGGGVLCQNSQTTLSVPLMASLRLGWVSALELMRQLTAATLLVLLVLLDARLLAFLAVVAAAACVVLVPTVALVRAEIPIRPSFQLRRWRTLIGPVLTYSAAAVTATLYLRVAIVLVSLIAGPRQLGYFSLSYRVTEALLALPTLLLGAAFPILARAALHDPRRRVDRRRLDVALAGRRRTADRLDLRRCALQTGRPDTRRAGHRGGRRLRQLGMELRPVEPAPAPHDPAVQPLAACARDVRRRPADRA
jgi:O-antigen/teichoic acid export membrane protein